MDFIAKVSSGMKAESIFVLNRYAKKVYTIKRFIIALSFDNWHNAIFQNLIVKLFTHYIPFYNRNIRYL